MGIESIKFVKEKDFADSEYFIKYNGNYYAYLKDYNAAFMKSLKERSLFDPKLTQLNLNLDSINLNTLWEAAHAEYLKADKIAKDSNHEKNVAENDFTRTYDEKYASAVKNNNQEELSTTETKNLTAEVKADTHYTDDVIKKAYNDENYAKDCLGQEIKYCDFMC